jgi:hypothetical protein
MKRFIPLIAIPVLLLLSGCMPQHSGDTYSVTVTGYPSEAQTISFGTGSGTEQVSNVALPYHGSTPLSGFNAITVVAQLDGSGDIECKITDTTTGEVLSVNKSVGDYAMVSCSASTS